MPAKLLVKPATGEPFEVEIGNTATIGRTRDNTVALSASPLVSRQHAVIRCHNGWQYQLIDLGSTNGTFVGDQRVVMPRLLEPGEVIRIGGNEITLRQAEEHHADETIAATQAGSMSETRSAAADVALLVCDIRGFSTAAEKADPAQLAQHLGAWFREAGNAIHATGGVIDKFIGDAVLAYWVKRDPPTECDLALQSGRKLLDLACAMTWPVSPDGLRVAVALHYGRVTCGNIGMDATRDATVIGDTVNIVFRLETLSKQLGRAVLCSQDFLARLPSPAGFDNLGDHELKGKRHPVRVFGMEGV
jgi:adenylate cyclase